jgi:2-(1,2-epoxy-1,2-dihydrophenyl)acetyl-CoA isomerase
MEMRLKLGEELLAIEHDPKIRCVVLRGAGDHFMAGGDVKTFAGMVKEQTPDELSQTFVSRIHNLHPIMFTIRRMKKPVVAAVKGAAAGAGVSMALACDLVIAADDAFFTLAYCHIGTSPDGSATFTLPRAVGTKKAMEIALLGERFTAQQAADMGMINFVVPVADFDAEVEKLAKRLASGPTRALGNTKALIYASTERQFAEQVQLEAETFADSAAGPDFREGVTAFAEKRKPNFTGG